jgi:outer membrane receptor protein involved in Fe transport
MKNFPISLHLPVRRKLVLNIAAAATSIGIALNSHAQAVSASTDASSQSTMIAANDTPPPVIVVTGHYDNSIGSTDAASAGVVLGALLEQRPLLRPGEVLETVPGLVVTQHSGDGKANQYFLRGYNLDHGTDFATSIDGVPVNMPTNAHGQGYSDLNFLIPELVDRIEYRKGTYFAENGDFSSAGSADIKYRDTLDHDFAQLTVGDSNYRRAVFAGSTVLSGDGDAGTPGTSDLRLLGGLELLENNGPWTLPEGLHKINGLLRLSEGTRANGWSMDGTVYQAYWNSTDQVPLSLIQSGQLGRYSALDPTDGGDSGRDILSGEWHQHDDDGYAKVSAFIEHSRLQLWSDFTFYELRPTTGDQFEQQESRNIIGTKAAKGWNHELFGHESVTEIGLQVRQDYIHVGLLNTEARVPFQVVSNDLVNETEIGTYIQNSSGWTNWFRTVAGLRLDDLHMGMTSLNIPENSGNASGQRLSPKLSMIFGPWDKTEFFANAGKGFHSNDARGVIDKIDPTTDMPVTQVPALVGSFGKEIGLRTEAIPGLQSSLALWSLNSDSEIIYDADSANGSTTPNGASERVGVEWNNHMRINRWLYADADFAWTRAHYATMNDNGQLGDDIPNAVGKVASFGIAMQHYGPWSAELNTRYIGSYPLSQDGTLVGPSAIVTNLRVQRDITPNVTLSLDVLNLFDRQYYDISYEQDYQITPASPVVPNGITVHPGEGREARLTLRVRI